MDHQAWIEKLKHLVELMQKAGADEAEAAFGESNSASVTWRMGSSEEAEWANSMKLNLHAFVNKREASISTNLIDEKEFKILAQRVVKMAKVLPQDPYSGLAAPEQLFDHKNTIDLDLYDQREITPEELIEQAKRCEDSARQNPHIVNSEGASAGFGKSYSAHFASNGFQGTHKSSHFSIGVHVIAGNEDGMEGDYDFSSKTHFEDLEKPEDIGKIAGEKAIRRLSSKKIISCELPMRG
ncbi:MAG: DNA gyrase modulator [Pseudomonadota bacterium]